MVVAVFIHQGEEEQLGVIALQLWNATLRAMQSATSSPKREDYHHYLALGAKSLALRALARRNRSKQWIYEKLIDYGVPQPLADRISQQMAQTGYASDRSLQGRILSEAERRGRGVYWIKRQMSKHRVSEEAVEAMAMPNSAKEVEAISRWLDQNLAPSEPAMTSAQRYKIFQRFLRRGYLMQSIEDALAQRST